MAIETDGNQETIERPGNASTGSKSRVQSAASAARSAVDGARDKVATAYSDARDGVASAYENAREKAAVAGRKASEGIDDNPVAAVVGGLALGAVVAAVLPRTDREVKALGAVGGKLNKAAKGAVDKARDAGKAKIGELGLDQAKDTVRKLVQDAVGKTSS